MSRSEKVAAFRALHVPGDPFVMPNPWDIGSAKLFAAQGAPALGTTSAGLAFTLGLPDGSIDRDTALTHARQVSAAVKQPVSGDFENGYGDDPEQVAMTVMLAAEAGLAGVSIEDTDLDNGGSYPRGLALDRIQAAVDAARYAEIVLCARADGWMIGAYDQAEAVRRCDGFAELGAEVIYAPLVDVEHLSELCAIGVPVNALASRPMAHLSRAVYAELGVARISIGGGLSRLVQASILEVGSAMLQRGDFSMLAGSATEEDIDDLLE